MKHDAGVLGSDRKNRRESISKRTVATRGVTFRDFLIFQLKLVLDGLKDIVVFNCSIAAMVLDVLSGGGKKKRLFYTVLRVSERIDLWLNLHGAAEGLDSTEDGLFGASAAGSPTLLGRLELAVRGGDHPRSMRRRTRRAPRARESMSV